jgi:hypothetical protein
MLVTARKKEEEARTLMKGDWREKLEPRQEPQSGEKAAVHDEQPQPTWRGNPKDAT